MVHAFRDHVVITEFQSDAEEHAHASVRHGTPAKQHAHASVRHGTLAVVQRGRIPKIDLGAMVHACRDHVVITKFEPDAEEHAHASVRHGTPA